MANVKITALTNLASGDVDAADVFIIDDVSVPESKKITVANLRAAVDTIATSNINTVSSNVAAVEARRVANTTIFLNEDTALQARITANNTLLHSNDFITFTRLQANIDLVQDNVASVTVGTASDTETRLNANLNVVQDNVTAVQSRLATNVTTFTNEDTALQARITANSTAFQTEDTALQARITANNTLLHSNDFITFTRLNANLDVIQDNVAAIIDGTTNFSGEVTMTDDLIVTGNLTVNGTTTTINTTNMDVDDTMIMLANGTTGSPSNDIGILFNRGNQGNAAIFYDESAKTFKFSDTKDPTSNTSLSPVTSSNIDVGILTAATITLNSVDLSSNLTALAAGIAASGSADFPTGDYGLLDSANSSTDSFGIAVAGLTTFDMKSEPTGSLATEDLGALT